VLQPSSTLLARMSRSNLDQNISQHRRISSKPSLIPLPFEPSTTPPTLLSSYQSTLHILLSASFSPNVTPIIPENATTAVSDLLHSMNVNCVSHRPSSNFTASIVHSDSTSLAYETSLLKLTPTISKACSQILMLPQVPVSIAGSYRS
jgi:hypothetical protein